MRLIKRSWPLKNGFLGGVTSDQKRAEKILERRSMERTRNRRELVADRAKNIRYRNQTHRRRCGYVKSGRDELDTRRFGGRHDYGCIRLIVTGFGQVFGRHN